MIVTIAKNEIRRLWLQPLVWVILAATFIIIALLFLVSLNVFFVDTQVKYAGLATAPGVTDTVIAPLLFWSAIIGTIILPIFTLRIMTEEKIRKQYVLLSTAPVSAMSIVGGKAIGLFSIIIAFAILVLLFPLLISAYTTLDWGKILVGLVGCVLFQISFGLLCLYFASLTQNIVFSVLSNYAALLFLFMLYFSGSAYSSESTLFLYISNFSHLLPALTGLLNGQDVIYYMIFASTFFLLTVVRIRFSEHH